MWYMLKTFYEDCKKSVYTDTVSTQQGIQLYFHKGTNEIPNFRTESMTRNTERFIFTTLFILKTINGFEQTLYF